MKYPIGLSIILNALAAISILSGCSDYLDREYDSFIDNEMTFTSYERTSKFLVNAYRYLPDGFNRIGSEAMLDAATDDAEHANAWAGDCSRRTARFCSQCLYWCTSADLPRTT